MFKISVKLLDSRNCSFCKISETVETTGTESFGNRNRFRYNKYALSLVLYPQGGSRVLTDNRFSSNKKSFDRVE